MKTICYNNAFKSFMTLFFAAALLNACASKEDNSVAALEMNPQSENVSDGVSEKNQKGLSKTIYGLVQDVFDKAGLEQGEIKDIDWVEQLKSEPQNESED